MERSTFLEALSNAHFHIMTTEDIPAFAESATSGYKDYPLFNYFCGGSYDEVQARTLWGVLLRSLPNESICFSDSPEVKGFAIWLPGSYGGTGVLPFLSAGGLKLPAKMGIGVFSRLLRYENHAQEVRMKLTGGQGWYFYNLVTRADCQGQGIGSSLIRVALDLMDEHGEQAYLETHKSGNVPIYEHYGFRLMEQSTLPGKSQLTHYAMLRDAVHAD